MTRKKGTRTSTESSSRAAGARNTSSKTLLKSRNGTILLSGGNPQIKKGYGNAPVQKYIAAMPGWKRNVGKRIHDLIVEAVPAVEKAIKWNTAFYGTKKDSWFLGFHCLTRYVKIAFFRGAELSPQPPGSSKQENVRYLNIHEGDEIDEALFSNWVKQGSKLPGKRFRA